VRSFAPMSGRRWSSCSRILKPSHPSCCTSLYRR
jgi:hypothetical protein